MEFVLSKAGWFLATPSNLLTLLAVIGVLGAGRPWGRTWGRPWGRIWGHLWGRRLAAGSLGLIAAFGIGPVGTWLLAPLENRFPPYSDDGTPIAGVVVLGGAVRPGLSFARDQLTVGDAAERVIAMADLARRHPAARIVFTGGSGAVVDDERPEAEAVARFAPTLGIDPNRILYENRSRTTAENARDTRALVTPKTGERWLLVTSAWHMPRAIGTFRRVGFPVQAYPVDYRTGTAGDHLIPEPSIASGLDRFDLAVREWAGLVAYRLAGRSESLLPAP